MPLGAGAYGTVLLYELQTSTTSNDWPNKVAVKVFQSEEVASREWKNWRHLWPPAHPT